MNDNSRLEELRRATAAAIEKYQAEQAALVAEARRGPRPGDLYLLPYPTANDIRWAVVGKHPEQDFLFAVPADGHPLVGLTDVGASLSSSAPLVLRCGHGLWLHPDDLQPEWRVATLEDRYVRRAVDKVKQIAVGKVEGTATQWETESSPDYEDWVAEVARSSDGLASTLRTREEAVSAMDFVRLPPEAVPAGEVESQLALAAASADPLARLYHTLHLRPGAAPPARRVDLLHPGVVYLLLEEAGVSVVHLGEGGQMPPELSTVSDEALHPAQWRTTPLGTASRAFFPWQAGLVQLRFGVGDRARDITVRQ